MKVARPVAVVLVGLVALAAPPPAQGAEDTTPPAIAANDAAAFVVGSTINASDPTINDTFDRYTTVRQRLRWTVTDDSGSLCAFDLYRAANEGYSPGDVDELDYYRHLLSTPSQRPTPWPGEYVDTIDDYDGALGSGGDAPRAWVMTAEDCSGNTSRFDIVMFRELSVLQEDNTYATDYQGWGTTDPGSLSYTGTWRKVSCACASGAAMRRTRARGASVTFTRTYERDDHVALVMAKGPRRGAADVYVDGVKRATVRTHAAKVRNRVVVFDRWMPAGTHTVRVVNRATRGHPRIDLDAVLTN
ncbi:hypothetical protein [Nocardioides sp. YIM 152588]|uniref:hypothetical protein n=1 Tax=Nocardioides sp. YIM 152588 TaxID=3158259 RepID=UPI0032E3E736